MSKQFTQVMTDDYELHPESTCLFIFNPAFPLNTGKSITAIKELDKHKQSYKKVW